ncbi:MAG: hypothetical protein IRY99_28010, partial [Isosphaeraceae bacterium]|nr:hypothetical protein [Isosphaeraceae bacterium]
AQAHDGFGYPGPGYGYGYGYPGFYQRYYGNGGHDAAPHWHISRTPVGTFVWYGNGPHDYRPHEHVRTPFGYRGYSVSPFGVTESIYPSTPYTWMPW